MKKNYFYLFLVLPIMAILFTSNSGGYTSGASGSPGDGGSGSTCVQCHSGGSFNANVVITSNVPSGGYALNTTYSVTVTLTSNSSSTKSGFQLTAEKSGGTKVGNFIAGTGSQTINSNKGVTHTSGGNSQKTWTFSWTSPATDQGVITFYVAANATNGTGATSGDQVVTSSLNIGTALNNENFSLATFKLFPNPTSDFLNIELPNDFSKATAIVVDVMGKTIINQELVQKETSINIQSLPAGTYILNLVSENASATKTFVKN